MQDSYNERLNNLIHGVTEDEDSVWEKREETTKIFHNILKTGLKIDNPEQIELIDIHQLLQHPVKKTDGSTFHRPIIVKLFNIQNF